MKEGDFIMFHGFSLFDSISALETMEPKMDCGLMTLEIKNSLLRFQSWQASPWFPSLESEPEDLLVLMDTLLACETMWLSGHSLLQSHLTCYYVEAQSLLALSNAELCQQQQRNLLDASKSAASAQTYDDGAYLGISVVKAMVFSLMVAGIHLRNIAMRYHANTEEDFQSYDFGTALPPHISPNDVMSLMLNLELALTNWANKSSNPGDILNIIARIKFRKVSFWLVFS